MAFNKLFYTLNKLHEVNIIHGDIKPANIMTNKKLNYENLTID